MRILTKWLRSYLPELSVSDAQLAENLTLRGIAVEGIYDLGAGNGSLYEMDITTNRVDAMNHYGVAREAAAIYGVALKPIEITLPEARKGPAVFPVRIEAEDACGRFTARVLRDISIGDCCRKMKGMAEALVILVRSSTTALFLRRRLGVQAPGQNWSPCSPFPPRRRLGAA